MFELKMVCSHFCSVQLYGSFDNEVITYQGVSRTYMKSHNPKRSVYVYLHPTITQTESHVFVMFTLSNPYYKWRPTESLISLENK